MNWAQEICPTTGTHYPGMLLTYKGAALSSSTNFARITSGGATPLSLVLQ